MWAVSRKEKRKSKAAGCLPRDVVFVSLFYLGNRRKRMMGDHLSTALERFINEAIMLVCFSRTITFSLHGCGKTQA